MSATDLLKRVTALGVRLDTDGGKLQVDAPRGTLTPELKADLASYKPELIQILTNKPASVAGGKTNGDGILPIFSKILGETVYFVNHNNQDAVKGLDGAVYFLNEIEVIVAARPSHKELRLIHLAKQKFGGTVKGKIH